MNIMRRRPEASLRGPLTAALHRAALGTGWAVLCMTVLGSPAAGEPARQLVARSQELPGRLLDPLPCPAAPHLIAFQLKSADERLRVLNTGTGEVLAVSSIPPDGEGPVGGAILFDGTPDWYTDAAGRHWITFVGSGQFSNMDVYISYINPDGSAPGRSWKLTSATSQDLRPRFSPDGRRIVFVSSRTGQGDLYLVEELFKIRDDILAGREVVPEKTVFQLTTNPEKDDYPEFSPNGRFVAYAEWGVGEMEQTMEPSMAITLFDLEERGEGPVRLTYDEKQETRPSWSSDGNRILFYYSEKIEDTLVDIGALAVKWGNRTGRPMQGTLIKPIERELAKGVTVGSHRGPFWGRRGVSGPEAGRFARGFVFIRKTEAGEDRVYCADLQAWEEEKQTWVTEVPLEGVEVPTSVAWSQDGNLIISAQREGQYGLFSVPAPASMLRLDEAYAPEVVEEPGEGFWCFRSWKAGFTCLLPPAGGLVWCFTSGPCKTQPPETTNIGSPPCPPGVNCSSSGRSPWRGKVRP